MSRRQKPPTELPRPPWSSARATPSRAPLSRESLTTAALKIVDDEGLDELSMRRLADAVGAVPSALYAHVSGKPELLQLMIDRAAGEVTLPVPDPERWQEQVKELARSMHRSLAAHRDLARANLANIPTGHNALKVIDAMLGLFVAGGLPKQAAAYGADVLPMYVTSSAFEGSLFRQRMEQEPDYFQKLGAYMRALPKTEYPTASTMVDQLLAPEEHDDARFEFGLEVVVRGLASMARPTLSRVKPKRR